MIVKLSKSNRKGKKFMVEVDDKKIHFGASGYSDYTINKNDKKMKAYIARHKPREKWGKSGIKTAGFWSRWLLWNKKTITSSIKDIENRFNINILYR